MRQSQSHDGQPIYRHECGLLYLYYISSYEGFWVIGMDIGSLAGFAVSYQPLQPTERMAKWYMWAETGDDWVLQTLAYLQCEGMAILLLVIHVDISM